VALTVDGRKVTDPVGFRASEIGATIFAAVTGFRTVDTWRRVAQELEFTTLVLTAAPLALAMGVSELQCVILDVGGGTTNLALWLNGQPVAFDSVPIGGASLTQTLMQAWDVPFDTAERLKRAYVGGYLADDDRAQVLEVMFPALRAWLEGTELAMARLDREHPLPQRVYLLGGGSAPREMVEAARALAWSERLHFVRYPQVGRLLPTDVSGVINRSELGGGTGDVTALALAASAARQTGQAARPVRILSELCDRHTPGSPAAQRQSSKRGSGR
jgi:cell division ATPase FtsA